MVLTVVAGCSTAGGSEAGPDDGASSGGTARLAAPPPVRVVDGGTDEALAIAVSSALFTSSPTAVLTAGDPDSLAAAARAAHDLGAPELVAGPGPLTDDDALTGELKRLGARTVLAVGPAGASWPDRLAGVEVVGTKPGSIADTVAEHGGAHPLPATNATVLVHRPPPGRLPNPGDAAAGASAAAAGATALPVAPSDPRADGQVVSALAARQDGPVLAAGGDFGSTERLTGRLAVARTGTQLPGGGQLMFPGRTLVALYGNPAGAALGALGEQDPAASVARAQRIAEPYRHLVPGPVVPTFEIIATVASGAPGPDGDYSNESSVESLEPLVDAAHEAGMYVVVDLQPGRADLVAQAQRYRSLLSRPDVGLAIDPEWALRPDQVPLKQIGSVTATQVNAVTSWLADLTAAARLPQKVLVLHQFRTSMITDEDRLDRSRDEVALLVHADGQGSRGAKEGTWAAVREAAPDGVPMGWKNFYDEDPQIASPEDTLDRTPVPAMVSYQ